MTEYLKTRKEAIEREIKLCQVNNNMSKMNVWRARLAEVDQALEAGKQVKSKPASTKSPTTKELKAQTVPELKKQAKKLGVSDTESMKKAELVKTLATD